METEIAYFGANVPLFAGECVLDASAVQFPVIVLVELGDLAIIGDCCPVLDGGHDERNVHPRVVMLSYGRGLNDIRMDE